jgi:RND superfamily putative drug exporter
VLVFQDGIGNELLGLREAETIDAWAPLFLFAVLFGLSMDYQAFLLSRIRERFTQTGDTDAAISFGIGSTARLITGAALIIIAVFWGFAMGDTIAFRQMGFGIAVALLIDATIIRSVLVPATMKPLGERNWYLPACLTWLPDAHVEGARAADGLATANASRKQGGKDENQSSYGTPDGPRAAGLLRLARARERRIAEEET